MAALRDEEVQIRGMVMVSYEVDRTFLQIQEHSLKDRVSSIPMYRDALPIRIASFHYCYNDPGVKAMVTVFHRFANKQSRIRFRYHFGAFSLFSVADLVHPCFLLSLSTRGILSTMRANSFCNLVLCFFGFAIFIFGYDKSAWEIYRWSRRMPVCSHVVRHTSVRARS